MLIKDLQQRFYAIIGLELGKIADFDFVYTLASTNINQSVPNLVKMNMTIRSRMSLIMALIGQELSELSVLELESRWDPGEILLYRIGPLPFSMACRKYKNKPLQSRD